RNLLVVQDKDELALPPGDDNVRGNVLRLRRRVFAPRKRGKLLDKGEGRKDLGLGNAQMLGNFPVSATLEQLEFRLENRQHRRGHLLLAEQSLDLQALLVVSNAASLRLEAADYFHNLAERSVKVLRHKRFGLFAVEAVAIQVPNKELADLKEFLRQGLQPQLPDKMVLEA